MNQLQGHIESVDTSGSLSLARIRVGRYLLSAIVIDTPATCAYLHEGAAANVIFKETEVVLGAADVTGISLQNKLPGLVETVEKGTLLSRVVLKTEIGELASVVTTAAVKQLGLVQGSSATALIKTNEIMLSAC